MRFNERLVIINLQNKIEARKRFIYEAYDETYFNIFGYYPDWNYETEVAADSTIKFLYHKLEQTIARYL